MKRNSHAAKIFWSSPLTWMVFLVILLIESAFMRWFRPPVFIAASVVGLGLVMLAVWPILFLRSQAFRQIFTRLPYELDMKELEKLLRSCSEDFSTPARECLMLLEKTRKEFQSQVFQTDLDRIFQNLFDLTRNHVLLYSRYQEFGTAEQKQTMKSLLQQQILSVQNSLATLKAFSGNLTLLDAHPDEYERMGNDLKAINLELENSIQEVQ